MFIVTVEFSIRPGHEAGFEREITHNAQQSLQCEPGCRQFDVCRDPQGGGRFFLYEVYDSRHDFELHLAAAHFRQFDHTVRDWVDTKLVRTFTRIHPAGM